MKIAYFGIDLSTSGQSIGGYGGIVNGGDNAPSGYITVKQPNGNYVLQPNGLKIFAPLI